MARTSSRTRRFARPGARSRAVAALDAAFGGHFTDNSLIHWGSKITRTIFDHAVRSADAAADERVFVGEDPDERVLAREAGMRTAAHPIFTRAATEGRLAFWIRIDVPEDRNLAELELIANSADVVPVHVASDAHQCPYAEVRLGTGSRVKVWPLTSRDRGYEYTLFRRLTEVIPKICTLTLLGGDNMSHRDARAAV